MPINRGLPSEDSGATENSGVPPTAFRYIDDARGLHALCAELAGSTWLALDTEFIREKTFHPQLCLIQVSNGPITACVDPLAVDNLDPLLDLIYDPQITKVMHAARQDLEIMLALRGTLPRPVFDTQVAATVLGYGDQIGYGTLVKSVLDIELEKAHTRTDWLQRPLDADQLDYAADDVRYLGMLYGEMLGMLRKRGRLDWLAEDFAALTNPNNYRTPAEEAWLRIKGTHKLRGVQITALRALAAWREEQALSLDRPRRWILRDEMLLELSRQLPDSLARLARLRGLESTVVNRHGADIVARIAEAKRLPRDQWPVLDPAERLAPSQEAVIDLLVGLIRQVGAEQGVSPAAIASRRDLEQVLLGDAGVPLLHGWRAALAGNAVQAVLAGHSHVSVSPAGLKIVTSGAAGHARSIEGDTPIR